ncbi:GNAT family N-acetyltransferase, partial [Streptomyces prasinus]|uniref:GNAT family N-acetyltransferase n=1 Tax=Streptomyces prasinus TaxID=67345 RepID=UPI0037CFF5DB
RPPPPPPHGASTASCLALHERAGFRIIGTRERIGRHHGRWRDVVLVERAAARVSERG